MVDVPITTKIQAHEGFRRFRYATCARNSSDTLWLLTVRMPHALIVDDDTIASQALAELVADQGFTTACADSVQAARDLLGTGPDLILLDLVLPDGSGIELLREATTLNGNTQVVVITGHASLESSIEAMRHGATDYLLKPINLSQLR